jgi:hypothetical protein
VLPVKDQNPHDRLIRSDSAERASEFKDRTDVWKNQSIQKYAADEDNEGMYENIRDLYARFKAS